MKTASTSATERNDERGISFGQIKPWVVLSTLLAIVANAAHWLWYEALPRSLLPGMDERYKYQVQWTLGYLMDVLSKKVFAMFPVTRVKLIRLVYWLTVAFPSVKDNKYQIDVNSINVAGLPAKLYQPRSITENGSCIIFIHGGGFFVGDIDTYDNFNYLLSHNTRKTLISLGYPLSPEHQYPEALDKITKSVNVIFGNESSRPYFCDAARSTLFGDSAGGNLAIALADRMEMTGNSKPYLISLLYPLLQMENFSTCSYQRYLNHTLMGVLDRKNHEDVILFYTGRQPQLNEYISDGECSHEVRPTPGKRINTELSPLFLSDQRLRLLPKILLFTVENDMLLDENEQFFNRVRQLKGDNVKRIHFPQGFHGQAHLVSGVFPYEYSWKMLEVIAENINSTLANYGST